MSKVKLKNRVFADGTMSALGELLRQPIGGRKAYELGKLAKQINDKAGAYEKARQSMISKYGKKDKDGQIVEEEIKDADGAMIKRVVFEKDNEKKFREELGELLDIEEEYEAERVSLSDSELDEIKIKPADMMLLEDIFDVK